MREIKFRAFYENVWYYQTLEEMLTITLAAFRLGTHKTQYTGLKDKNDNEIYEGDILQDQKCTAWLNWLIEYHEGSVCLVNIGVDGYRHKPMILTASSAKERVVIGNIYQNPDLC